jgi:phage terminase large subunit-like protein
MRPKRKDSPYREPKLKRVGTQPKRAKNQELRWWDHADTEEEESDTRLSELWRNPGET